MWRGLAERIELVDELHHRRHRRVQVHPLLDVHGGAPDRVVRFAAEGAFSVCELFHLARPAFPALPAQKRRPMVHETPHAHQEPEASLDPRVAPLDFLFRRRDKHHVQPQRIRAVLLHHRVRIDDVALRLGHDVDVLEHHALREEACKRLVERNEADVAEHAREEPRIQQVQNRVLDASDIEIDRHPVRGRLLAERQLAIFRIGEAEEVPRGVDERVHRVGLAPGGTAALRTFDVDELRNRRERRIAAPGELRHLRELHRQLLVRNSDDAVLLAKNHRDRRAPVALP